MNYTSDPQFLSLVFILPGFFGLSLLGEGVSKIMNYDRRGWIGIAIGVCFLVLILLAYLTLVSNIL